MPPNVTMHEPHAGVIVEKRNHEVSARRQHSSISARRVLQVQGDVGRVGAEALGEDVEVEAVQVDGVRDVEGRFDGDVGPRVGLGEVDHGVGAVEGVALVDFEERRVRPVDDHGGAVEEPFCGSVEAAADERGVFEDVCCDFVDVPGDHWDELGGVFVEAGFDVGGCGSGWRGGVAAVVDDALHVFGVGHFGAGF